MNEMVKSNGFVENFGKKIEKLPYWLTFASGSLVGSEWSTREILVLTKGNSGKIEKKELIEVFDYMKVGIGAILGPVMISLASKEKKLANSFSYFLGQFLGLSLKVLRGVKTIEDLKLEYE